MKTRSSLLSFLFIASACGQSPSVSTTSNPNAGMFRDFEQRLLTTLDESGHPLNARVTRGADICRDGECRGVLEGGVQRGDMTLNIRLRATPADVTRAVLTVEVDGDGRRLASRRLDGRSLRTTGD